MTTLRSYLRAALCSLAALLLAGTAFGGSVTYQINLLEAFSGEGVTRFSGINNSGEVVGFTDFFSWGDDDTRRAFKYTPWSGLTVMGTFTGTGSSYATGINNSGRVVGYAYTPVGDHAFIHTPGQGMVSLGTLGGFFSAGLGINNSGQAVGYSHVGVDQTMQAFLYTPGSGMINLGTLTGEGHSAAFGVNDLGWVVGLSSRGPDDLFLVQGWAFLYTPEGGMISLGTLGGDFSQAVAINNAGQIIGYSSTADGSSQAFLYTLDEGMKGLGTLAGGSRSSASGINDIGQIVGTSGGWGFLYDDGVMKNLNDLIDPASGWTITQAQDINDRGWIVALGVHAEYGVQPLVLTPIVPEPSSFLLAAVGATGVLMVRRRTSTPSA